MKRSQEKQLSRKEDDRKLASGEITREQLRKTNGIFYGCTVKIRWDLIKKLY